MASQPREQWAADYVPVNERIAAFYEKHPEGSLQSTLIELTEKRVVMRGEAYRSPDDQRPGIGFSSLEIPGRTPYTRGSEIENAETSAWGRALAALGFEVKRGIASKEEVENKSGDSLEERGVPRPTTQGPRDARPIPEAAPAVGTPSAPTGAAASDLSDAEWEGVLETVPVASQEPLPAAEGMTTRELFTRAEKAGIDKKALGDKAKQLFGRDKWSIKDHLSDAERLGLAEELGLA